MRNHLSIAGLHCGPARQQCTPATHTQLVSIMHNPLSCCSRVCLLMLCVARLSPILAWNHAQAVHLRPLCRMLSAGKQEKDMCHQPQCKRHCVLAAC